MTKLDLTFEDSEKEQKLKHRVSFELPETRFSFVNNHFGFRKGKIHTLISSSGAGKSTLARSLLLDVASKEKVFLYSSEEDLDDTKTMLFMRDIQNDILKNISFMHEGEFSKKESLEEFLRVLEVQILNTKSKILFFDNITTSDFYEPHSPSKQAGVFAALRDLAARLNIPFFLIAHTISTVKDDQQSLIKAEDIWGSKSPARKSQFLYVYQRLIGESSATGLTTPMYGIVRTLKARGYDTHEMYLLKYNHESSEYTGDSRIPNSKFKEIYDSRFKLGR